MDILIIIYMLYAIYMFSVQKYQVRDWMRFLITDLNSCI